MAKQFGVALEQIWMGDVVVWEDGKLRRLRPSDGPLEHIKLPAEIRDLRMDVEQENQHE